MRAIASLLQVNLEVERDGDRLQELFAFYAGLGLPVYVGQLGLPGTDEAFLAMGRELEGKTCASPFGTAAAEWQIAGRKNWNWGEKNLGVRDDKVLAAELLEEPDVKALVPRIKALPAQRIAVIGHSFTMQLHWSTPGAFVPIVTAIFARENPGVEFRQFQGGGLTSTRALEPLLRRRRGLEAAAGAARGDQPHGRGPRELPPPRPRARRGGGEGPHLRRRARPEGHGRGAARRGSSRSARETGMTVIEVSPLLAAAPDRGRFLCLDGIHMTEPYHRLMAKQWLAFLVGARRAGARRPRR